MRLISELTNQLLVDYFDRMSMHRQDALVELLELRKELEVQAASLAAARRSDSELQDMIRLVGQMRRHSGDLERYLDTDVNFQLCIAAASHNRMLYQVVESIRNPARDTMREGQVLHPSPAERGQIQRNHDELVRLIEVQDPHGAATCMARHFDEAIAGIEQRGAHIVRSQ